MVRRMPPDVNLRAWAIALAIVLAIATLVVIGLLVGLP